MKRFSHALNAHTVAVDLWGMYSNGDTLYAALRKIGDVLVTNDSGMAWEMNARIACKLLEWKYGTSVCWDENEPYSRLEIAKQSDEIRLAISSKVLKEARCEEPEQNDKHLKDYRFKVRMQNYVRPSWERDLSIWELRQAGQSGQEIGDKFGLGRQRIYEIVERVERKLERFRAKFHKRRGRVIDMGGPRDRWLTWTPEMQAREFAAGR